MDEIGSIVIPIVITLILAAGVTGSIAAYFRFERHRTKVLTAELAKNREIAERAAQQQDEARVQLAVLSERIAAVEKLLRSVD